MATTNPDPALVRRAIDQYVRVAYGAEPPPVTVRSLLATLRGWGGDFLDAPVFAKEPSDAPNRYSLRLGNPFYPHMKLIFQRGPDGGRFLFRAETHDRHICPPADTPEYAHYLELVGKNQKLAEAIDAAWETAGIPTFKSYLKEDLARRQAQPK